MERKRIHYVFLFIVLMLVFSSCHSRHVSDIKLAMTKEEVVSLWGRTNLITYKTVNGTTLEHGNTILLALVLSVGSLSIKIE